MSFWRAAGISLLLVLAQIICTVLFSGAHSVGDGYFKLLNWDSAHYESIALKGYSYPADGKVVSDDIHAGRANVVFFPGYPLATHFIHEIFGISIPLSLLLVAQFSALVSWLYFILILSDAGISRDRIFWGVLAVFAYPSAFFMVTGYTESVFIASALGFIYWCDRRSILSSLPSSAKASVCAWCLALLHGWAMCLTRIVGFAVAAYPVFRDGMCRRVRRASVALFGLSVLTSMAFFIYCQLKFGDWAVYFKLEDIGWQNHREYFAILNPFTYVPHFFFEDTVDSISRSSVTLGAVLFVAWGWREFQIFRKTGQISDERIATAGVALMMFYISVTGKANSHLDSMLRYTLPVYILWVLNFAKLNQVKGSGGGCFFSDPRRRWKLGISFALGFGVQFWCMYRFTHGHWVA